MNLLIVLFALMCQHEMRNAVDAGAVLEHPVFPQAEAQVVEGKHTPLEREQAKAEKAKRKREQADYNREHPGPIRQFFGMVFFPVTTLFSLVMSPFGLIWFVFKWIIALCVLAVLGLVAIWLIRFFRQRYQNTVK